MSEEESAPEGPSRGSLPPPFVLAMLFCDSLSIDLVTGKTTFHGCFNGIMAPGFPVTQPAMVAYVAMTNWHGKATVQIRVIDTDEQRDAVFSSEAVVEYNNPLGMVELRVPMLGVTFPEPGEYRLQVRVDGHTIAERRLIVAEA